MYRGGVRILRRVVRRSVGDVNLGGDGSLAPAGAPRGMPAMVGGSVILDARVPGMVSGVPAEVAVAKMQMQFYELWFGPKSDKKVVRFVSKVGAKLSISRKRPNWDSSRGHRMYRGGRTVRKVIPKE